MSKYKEHMARLGATDILKGAYNRPSAYDIRQIELDVGCSLPTNYIEFLMDCGGFSRYDYDTTFTFQRPGNIVDEASLAVIYGVLPGHGSDILLNYRTYKDRMPYNLIPIATDMGPGEICISLYGRDKESVYYWDRYLEEDGEDGKEPGYSNLFLIAKSLDDFINSVMPHKDDEI